MNFGIWMTNRHNTATYTKGQRYWTQGQYRGPPLLAILGGRSLARNAGSTPQSVGYGEARVRGFVSHLPAFSSRVEAAEVAGNREYRRPFRVALPVPRSNGHGRRHSAGYPSRCKRISARALGSPTGRPIHFRYGVATAPMTPRAPTSAAASAPPTIFERGTGLASPTTANAKRPAQCHRPSESQNRIQIRAKSAMMSTRAPPVTIHGKNLSFPTQGASKDPLPSPPRLTIPLERTHHWHPRAASRSYQDAPCPPLGFSLKTFRITLIIAGPLIQVNNVRLGLAHDLMMSLDQLTLINRCLVIVLIALYLAIGSYVVFDLLEGSTIASLLTASGLP